MNELLVSINNISSDPKVTLQPLLDAFSAQAHVNIRLQTYDWGVALEELNKFARYRTGPAVSHIGTTWMGSLAPQMALRPFSAREVASMGGSTAFFPAAWQTTHFLGSSEVLAIPWLADTYVLYYRRDALQRAGIDETTAFATVEQFPKTLAALRESGHPFPWISHVGEKTLSLVHQVSNWIWGAGGEFISANGKQVAFNSPQARAGIKQYFELQRFLPAEYRRVNDYDSAQLYFQGRAAVTLSSHVYVHWLNEGRYPAEVAENTGVAVPPGIPFVGGSNWVIWLHTPYHLEPAALEFIAYMASEKAQVRLHQATGQLPAHLKALSQSTSNPHYAAVLQTLQTGRPFPSTRLWGLVEIQLTAALFNISTALLENPAADIDALLDEHLIPLEQRLNITLSS